MTLPPKTHISTWNSIHWLKLTSFIDHRNLPHPWTTFMGSIIRGTHLLKEVCASIGKKKLDKYKLEKNEYHLFKL